MSTERTSFDVIVCGVGAMGSATVYQLARRGLKVLGLERFNIPHNLGSSHGITRIIRLCYYEHPSYVPLLRRAYELWRELEHETGERLLHVTGSIDAGPPDSTVLAGSLASCREHGLPHELLTSSEVSRRFPAYRLPEETLAVLQPDGGFLTPERCIVQHVTRAQERGAVVRAREPVIQWEADAHGVRVTTDKGTYHGGKLVIAAGAWLGRLVPQLARTAIPERQVLGWFQPERPEWFRPEACPVFNVAVPEGRYYGLPIYGVPGFKVGRYHHWQQQQDPDRIGQDTEPEDEAILRDFVQQYFPAGAGPTMALAPCMFTNTADEHFILDRHPEHENVILASPCSGHGFKFASVVGEIVADLAERGATRHDIALHRLPRLLN